MDLNQYSFQVVSAEVYNLVAEIFVRKMILDASTLFVKSYKKEKDTTDSQVMVTYMSGSSFSGNFRGTQFDGHGFFTWKDGVSYEGNFASSRMSGAGEYRWLDCRYSGDVTNGIKNGIGTFQSNDEKLSYSGEWSNGIPHGRGACKYANGDQYYGCWKMGMRHGNGTMVYKSGNSYDGLWFENHKSGKGIMLWNKGRERYDGEWLHGQPNGYGVYTWIFNAQRDFQFPSLNIYKGSLAF